MEHEVSVSMIVDAMECEELLSVVFRSQNSVSYKEGLKKVRVQVLDVFGHVIVSIGFTDKIK